MGSFALSERFRIDLYLHAPLPKINVRWPYAMVTRKYGILDERGYGEGGARHWAYPLDIEDGKNNDYFLPGET